MTILVLDGKHVIGHVGLGNMKLLEFFSKNQDSEVEDQTDDDVKKEVMSFILDNDDLYKNYMMPLVNKIQKGQPVSEKDYKELVNNGCLEFYKKKEMTIDPNDVFPKSMRLQMAKELHSINKDQKEK